MGSLKRLRHQVEDHRDSIVIALVLASAGWTALTAHNESHTAKEAKGLAVEVGHVARGSNNLAAESKHLADEIQAERVDSIYAGCNEQNARNTDTIKALDKILHKVERRRLPRSARVQLRESRASTLLLINALAPKQNCNARVERFASTSGLAATIKPPTTTKGSQ